MGEDTIFFNKVKIDNYAPYSQVIIYCQIIIIFIITFYQNAQNNYKNSFYYRKTDLFKK